MSASSPHPTRIAPQPAQINPAGLLSAAGNLGVLSGIVALAPRSHVTSLPPQQIAAFLAALGVAALLGYWTLAAPWPWPQNLREAARNVRTTTAALCAGALGLALLLMLDKV